MPGSTAQDVIVDAVLAALRQAPAITTGPIDEDVDLDAVAETHAEAVSVELVSSQPQESTTGYITWTSRIAVLCLVRRDGRTAGQPRASRALHAKAFARLMADRGLGGLAIDVSQPAIRPERQQLDTRMGACIGLYDVRHRVFGATLDA